MDVTDCTYSKNYRYMKKDIFKQLGISKRRLLGSGFSSDVYLAKYKAPPQTEVAAKVFPLKNIKRKKRDRRLNTFIKESAILRELDHKNIVLHIHSFLCPNYAVILTEYFPDGSLYEQFTKLTDVQVRRYFFQISTALAYLHEKRIVHRDVKHQNVLLKGKDAYLTDFGLSKLLPEDDFTLASFAGTPEYMAPEVYRNYAISTAYDAYKADTFAMGVLTWSMIMKEDREEGDLSLCRLIEQKRHEFPILTGYAIRMLKAHPVERDTVTQILVEIAACGYDFLNVQGCCH